MSDTTADSCRVPACPADIRTAGFCSRHYQQQRKGRDPYTFDLVERLCAVCHADMGPWVKRGNAPLTCSEPCRLERHRNYKYQTSPSYLRRMELVAQRQYYCVGCGIHIKVGGKPGPTTYCSDCALAVRRAQPKDSATRTCGQPSCDRPTRARDRCAMHYKVWARAEGRLSQSHWNDRTKANRALREQRISSNRTGIRPTVARLLKRDGAHCGWCDQPIDMTLTYPHRMYRTIDHVVPLSKGGEHSMDNTRLLHWACNSGRCNSDALTKSDAKSASRAA